MYAFVFYFFIKSYLAQKFTHSHGRQNSLSHVVLFCLGLEIVNGENFRLETSFKANIDF